MRNIVLNFSTNRITFVRFAQTFARKLMILVTQENDFVVVCIGTKRDCKCNSYLLLWHFFRVDFTNSTAERKRFYVHYYGYYVTITSLLRGQSTLS